jgi:hypothetical protein
MGRRLATHVWVQQKDGRGNVVQSAWFGPDDDLPDWAEAAITHDKAYVDESGSDGPPPKAGRGSGLDAWKAYASVHEVEVPDGASKDDVIAALESAGVPTESE